MVLRIHFLHLSWDHGKKIIFEGSDVLRPFAGVLLQKSEHSVTIMFDRKLKFMNIVAVVSSIGIANCNHGSDQYSVHLFMWLYSLFTRRTRARSHTTTNKNIYAHHTADDQNASSNFRICFGTFSVWILCRYNVSKSGMREQKCILVRNFIF